MPRMAGLLPSGVVDNGAIQPAAAKGIDRIDNQIAIICQLCCVELNLPGVDEEEFVMQSLQSRRNRFGAATGRSCRVDNTNAHDRSFIAQIRRCR
jgi:hypothetical protein